MKKLLIILPILLLFSCSKEKISIPSDEVIKVTAYCDQIEEGESVSLELTYKLAGEPEEVHELEMSVLQGVHITEVGLGQLIDLKSLSLEYETSDELRIWHQVSNMNESEIYEEISPIDLHNTVMQFDYSF